jgi:hypothetical protein
MTLLFLIFSPQDRSDMPRRFNPMPIAQQRHELYQAIGEAITTWASVEDQLADLFAYFIAGDAQSLTAKAAFHAVINFNAKRAMMDEAAQWRIGEEHLTKWNSLQYSFFLSPSLQNVTALLRGDEPPRISFNDIKQRTGAFRKLARDLSAFAGQVPIGTLQGGGTLSVDNGQTIVTNGSI